MTHFQFPFDKLLNTGKNPTRREFSKQISTHEGQGSSREYQLGVIEVSSSFRLYLMETDNAGRTFKQWRIQGGARPSLFLDQTEARGAEKNFFGTVSPPPTPLPCRKVWIRHC